MGLEKKKMMIHLRGDAAAAAADGPDCSLSLSLVFFSFIRRLRYTLAPFLSLYIKFQPNSLTLSVSRNKETCKSKQATTNRR